MANNCYNYITLSGSASEIQIFSEFLNSHKGENGEENTLLYLNLKRSFAEEITRNDAGWFDMDLHEYHESEEEFIISGDSAWSPCLELFTAISEKFPNLEIRYEYEEGGCDFAGWAEIQNGQCADNCFTFWEGRKQTDYDHALSQATEEAQTYDGTEEEFLDEEFYTIFSEEQQAELLREFRESN